MFSYKIHSILPKDKYIKTKNKQVANSCDTKLVGGFNPFEKYQSIGNLPQNGVKIKNIWNHHPVNLSNSISNCKLFLHLAQSYMVPEYRDTRSLALRADRHLVNPRILGGSIFSR